MPDRIFTAEIAQALQDDSTAEWDLPVLIVAGSEGEMVARPVTSGRGALGYVLTAETLAELRARPWISASRYTLTPKSIYKFRPIQCVTM